MSKFKVNIKPPEIPDLPQEDSGLSLFDPNNPDMGLMNAVDEEIIRLGGSKVKYYKSYVLENYDKVYLEERNKVIDKNAITVWCNYDPTVIEESLTEFGIELTNDQVFVFNKTYIERILQRPPKEGDIVETMFQDLKFEIFEVQEDSFESYGVYHFNCHARLLRDSKDVVSEPENDTFETPGGLTT